MKNRIFTLTFIFVSVWIKVVFAQQVFSGYVVKRPGTPVQLAVGEMVKTVPVAAENPPMANVLSRLENLDFVRCSGHLEASRAFVNSIDFVGLRRILGSWKAGNLLFQFYSFSDLSIFSVTSNPNLPHGNYKYAITPANTPQDWRIFFTDEKQVLVGSLNFSPGATSAMIQLYDSSSGRVVQKIHLLKVKGYNDKANFR